MTALTDRITKVMRKHGGGSALNCFPCGYQASNRDDMDLHVAQRIEAELGLTEETSWFSTSVDPDSDEIVNVRRWVSAYEEVQP